MKALSTAFEAVIFDLDGTLVATDRFWPDAARAGALRAFAQLHLTRELPTSEEWMSLVGLPLEEGFDQLFFDLTSEQRRVLLDSCVEEEHRLLEEGRAGLLPGVTETLETLHKAGIPIGIASNCSQAYLDAMLGGAKLDRWVTQSRCLQSPGIRNKADMIQELLIEFRTRRALMVGDRDGDRLAAWANGLPHVHLTRGYAAPGESVPAEAVLAGMDELVPRMLGRSHWIGDALLKLSLGKSGVLGILGPPGAGKAWMAEDLRRLLEKRGSHVTLLDAGEFLDHQALAQSLPGPQGDPARRVWSPQEVAVQASECLRVDALLKRVQDPGPGWLIVHGALLHQPRVLRALDRVLTSQVALGVAQRRVRGGHPVAHCPPGDAVEWAKLLWGWEQALASLYPGEVIGHHQIQADNWLGPDFGESPGK